MLEKILITELFAILLVFCRLGSALMVVPGIGDAYVPVNVRLLLALAISVVMSPLLLPDLPAIPDSPLALFILLLQEILIGLFFGGVTRILIGTIHTAGMIMAFQSSLASALLFDVTQGSQGSAIGNFIGTVSLALIFATDLHHVMLAALYDSYTLFLPGILPPIGDFPEYVARLMAESFAIAFRLAAPLVVVGLILYLGAGVLSRLMPAMHVFFVIIPLQISIAFFVLMTTLSGALLMYFDYFSDKLTAFIAP